MTTPTGSLEPDTFVHGRYRVVRQIGRGGMGAVYEAVDTRLGNSVALKQTLVRGVELDEAFAREARLLSSLRHPALPVVSDYFAEGESHFLVMQFIPGADLATLMAERGAPFGLGEALPWADQILDALDYLHTQAPPIIHRDIKPQNLKLTPRGEIVLLDFGLAKGGTTGLDSTQAAGASIFGYTPQYAPLEQIQATGTDPRSDLYSLAATLYALLTHGTPPNALERASAVLQGRPDPLRPLAELNPQAPRALSDFLTRCMALSAAERPASAAAMRAELKAAVSAAPAGATSAGMPTIALPGATHARPAAPPPVPVPTPPPALPVTLGSRGCLPLVIIGGVGLLLMAILAGAMLFIFRSLEDFGNLYPDGPPPTVVAAPTADPREVDPTAPLPTVLVATAQAGVPDVPDAAATALAGMPDVAATVAAVQATAEAAFGDLTPDGPSFGTVLLEFGEEGTGDGFLDDPRAIAVGPDGAIYVADYGTRRVQRFSPEGRFERSFFVEDDRPILAIAADRQGRVLVSQNFQVSLFDGATGEFLGAFADANGDGFEDLEVLGDGSMIAIPWAGGDLVRLSADGVETGRIPEIMAAADADTTPQAIAADGLGTLYILADDGNAVYVFSPEGAYKDKFPVADGSPFVELAVDSQGRVYVPGFFGGVQVFEADGGAVGTITMQGATFDLTFDDQGDLYAVMRTRVVKVRPGGAR